MKKRKNIKEFSSSELIAMARKSIENGELGENTFKEVNDVDFTFIQLCNSLHKRRCCGIRIMTYDEYFDVKNGMKKAGLNILFLEIQKRYEGTLLYEREKNI